MHFLLYKASYKTIAAAEQSRENFEICKLSRIRSKNSNMQSEFEFN